MTSPSVTVSVSVVNVICGFIIFFCKITVTT